ncbi:MAG: hypothetical protein ACOYJ2_07800 [Rickettsiales bacterium]
MSDDEKKDSGLVGLAGGAAVGAGAGYLATNRLGEDLYKKVISEKLDEARVDKIGASFKAKAEKFPELLEKIKLLHGRYEDAKDLVNTKLVDPKSLSSIEYHKNPEGKICITFYDDLGDYLHQVDDVPVVPNSVKKALENGQEVVKISDQAAIAKFFDAGGDAAKIVSKVEQQTVRSVRQIGGFATTFSHLSTATKAGVIGGAIATAIVAKMGLDALIGQKKETHLERLERRDTEAVAVSTETAR